jgi:ribulose-5-phosphate 4-epimerase/fuculose-1-phosphate aldolase
VTSEIADEAAARIHLAGLYRLIDHHYPSTDGIYNHLSLRIPGRANEFLIKRHDLLYNEVTASNLVVADMSRDLDEKSHINRPGFVLHSAILRARLETHCVVHIHSIAGQAMTAHGGGLKMLSQNAVRFYNRIGYHPYEGITEDDSEAPRIVQALGAENIVLVLHNHGLAILGRTSREAFERTRDFLIACETQFMLEAAGAPLIEIPREICEKVSRQFVNHDSGRGQADWPAWMRFLDRVAPDFRD